MLLRIKWNPADVVESGNGEVLLKVTHYGPYANAGQLVTTEGSTPDDFTNNKAKANKSILVGTAGKITLE